MPLFIDIMRIDTAEIIGNKHRPLEMVNAYRFLFIYLLNTDI